jgi:hypothetical protein
MGTEGNPLFELALQDPVSVRMCCTMMMMMMFGR